MPIVLPSPGSKQVASVHAEIGADTSKFEKAAVGVKSGMGDIGNSAEMAAKKAAILGTVVSATSALIIDSYKSYSALAESVRDLSLVSGTSAEETSRFIQVLDDFQLTADDATIASKKLKEQGLTPNIETLAMLSDEFRKIEDPALRLQFVQENLGKAGAKWVNVLNQGGDALRKLSKEVDKNLILTKNQIILYETQRLALDGVTDSVEGFKVQLGASTGNVIAYLSAMQRAKEIQGEHAKAVRGGGDEMVSFDKAMEMAIAEQLRAAQASVEQGDALIELEKSAQAAQEALELLSEKNAALVDSAIDITESQRDYQEEQDDIIAKIAETRAEGEKLYPWEYEKIEENKKALEDLGNQYFENRDKFIEATNEKLAMMAVEKIAMLDGVEGFSEAEFQKAQAILETTDVATAAAFDQAQAQQVLTDAVANGRITVEQFRDIMKQTGVDGVLSMQEVTAALEAIPSEKTITISVNTAYAGADLNAIAAMSPGRGRGTNRSDGRAGGGWVSAGQSYLVGERGMELFTPSQSGNITPNSQIATSGGMTINIMLDSATPDPDKVAYNLAPAVERVLRQRRLI